MASDLAEQLAVDDSAEDRGMHPDDRATCHTHQTWFVDCVGDPSHSNPVTGFNWCREHWQPVQVCCCRPATVNG